MADSFRYNMGSDNYLWAYRVLHPRTGKPVTNVAGGITATVYDEDGATAIAGQGTAVALPFEYVPGTRSDYRCVVPGDLPVTAAHYYPVKVVIVIDGLRREINGVLFAVEDI